MLDGFHRALSSKTECSFPGLGIEDSDIEFGKIPLKSLIKPPLLWGAIFTDLLLGNR